MKSIALSTLSSVMLLMLAASCSTTTPQQGTKDRAPSEGSGSVLPSGEIARNLTPTTSTAENVLLRGATILTATGQTIQNGDLWLKDGTIQSLGASPLEGVPSDVTVVDVTGKFITPGLIDTHSHLGVYPTPRAEAHADGNEATAPTTPGVQAIHSVWPQDPGFQRALAGGVTSLQILPGSANLIGGRSVTLQLHPGISSEAMRFPGAPGGVKMACGENPKRVYGNKGRMPSTRMGSMAVWRGVFAKAAESLETYEGYNKARSMWEASGSPEDKKPKAPGRDLGAETLMDIIGGRVLVHVHCYRADEMIQVLQLADEFGFKVRSFHHAVEAYKIRDILAKWDVSVSTWADWWGFKIEAHDAIMQNAGLLSASGARAIIHSDSAYDIQRLNQEASKAYWAAKHQGVEVTENDALRWITANPAWALGIDQKTGTLEEGKRADVTVWSAHPLSVYAKAELVFVEGHREFDISVRATPWSDFEVGQLPMPVPVTPPADQTPTSLKKEVTR